MTASILPVIILLALGLGVLAVLLFYIGGPLLSLALRVKNVSAAKERSKTLLEFSSYIEAGEYERASAMLIRVPFLDLPKSTESLLLFKDHNQDYVSKCLQLAEKTNSPTSKVATLEVSFTERFDLLSLLFKAQVNRRVLEEKRSMEGGKLPEWSVKELNRREKELIFSLNENLIKLKKEILSFQESVNTKSSEGMTLH